jgi:hypothetical protein
MPSGGGVFAQMVADACRKGGRHSARDVPEREKTLKWWKLIPTKLGRGLAGKPPVILTEWMTSVELTGKSPANFCVYAVTVNTLEITGEFGAKTPKRRFSLEMKGEIPANC